MKHWIIKIGMAVIIVSLLALAGSCNPFNPLAAAGFGDLKIYWVTSDPTIYRANVDGSNREQILYDGALTDFQAITVDKNNDIVFWSDQGFIYRMNLDGSGREVLRSSTASSLALDSDADLLYFATGSDIWRMNLDGSSEERIRQGSVAITDLALDLAKDKIYWSEDSQIAVSPISSNVNSTFSYLFSPDRATTVSSFTIDISAEKLYWSESSDLYKSDLSGSNIDVVKSFLSYPFSGIAIDPIERVLYWSEDTSAASGTFVRSMRVDGTNQNDIYSFPTEHANDVFLDLWP
jgi:hypothetical protein